MMITTPLAPFQKRSHDTNHSPHLPFRDHLHLKRHASSMLPSSFRSQSTISNGRHGNNSFTGDGPTLAYTPYRVNRASPEAVHQRLPVDPAAPDHMLRRKTPNGTLKAGYDGTPVGWASRPPAHKQQVRTHARDDAVAAGDAAAAAAAVAAAAEASARRQSCILLSGPASNGLQHQSAPGHGHGLPTQDAYSPLEYPMQDVNIRQMFQRAGQVQPMDSMLFQAAPHLNFYAAGHPQFPVPMQSTWPRNIEPTASGPPMSYGAYWPDGGYIPYRPTAVREPIFHNQFACISLDDTNDAKPWPARQSLDFDHASFCDPAYLGQLAVGGPVNPDGPVQADGRIHAHHADMAAAPSPYEPGPGGDGATSYPRNMLFQSNDMPPAMLNSTLAKPAMSGSMGASPLQLRFKELALAQAHRAYTSLLALMQEKNRKQSQQSSKGHKPFPTMFPKPPRNSYPLDRNGVARMTSAFDPRLRPKLPSAHHSPLGSVLYGQSAVSMLTEQSIVEAAQAAFNLLRQLVQQSGWTWIDAMLLGGCLAYGLNNFAEAAQWFNKVIARDPANVEAMSNLAAAYVTMNRRKDAEELWSHAVKQRPGYFEAIEHLISLLCVDQRVAEVIDVIQYVQKELRLPRSKRQADQVVRFDYNHHGLAMGAFGSGGGGASSRHYEQVSCAGSGYRIHPSENGRLIALIHARGNMLYASGNIGGAAQAFEEAIMVSVGRVVDGISELIRRILDCFASEISRYKQPNEPLSPWDAVLLLPCTAVKTAQYVFPGNSGVLPGLTGVADGQPRKAALAVTSNCLLSLAKIYQDSMSSGSVALGPMSGASGVQDILALYYLSLSLQPSPSTANNVGILLAGVQQPASNRLPAHLKDHDLPDLPGVVPGTGIALALAYYQFGLGLDHRHAHLYTNLGSLLKDLGQLDCAINMYEKAVHYDGKFDIALANLANAVKDRGKISDAIGFYRRAVEANPDFAEAVCGLANALNSVCGWAGRGGVVSDDKRFDRWHVGDDGMLADAHQLPAGASSGWIGQVVQIVNRQLNSGRSWGKNIISEQGYLHLARNAAVRNDQDAHAFLDIIRAWSGKDYEGAKLVRWVERATRRISWQWYQDKYVHGEERPTECYRRPQLPAALSMPTAPTVLPFHTFTCPLTASQIRQISQRNGVRISASTLKAPWLPRYVYRPPPPPKPVINVGYVSSDFNNHPLAHLMQSVFGMHNRKRVKAFCYATTPSDRSTHRQKIEQEAPVFYDASTWPVDRLVSQVVKDEIHILVNLNGYTRGARNEVFAARPAPIQMSFMGFAGTLGAEWCDYLLADEIAVPPSTLRRKRDNVTMHDVVADDNFGDKHSDWVYGENIVYTRDTFFCCDHRQSAPDAGEPQLSWAAELQRRHAMRGKLFPHLPNDVVILGNFNQLYKIEPTTFRTWLRILKAVPKAVLWLLRFPDLGEANLLAMAEKWADADVCKRIIFTDVAPKHEHIARARICDLFLDTPECNAHTTAADVLWSGTPLLTYPRYDFKMCSRMAASIVKGAMPRGAAGEQAARELTVSSDDEYETKASELANGLAAVLAGAEKTCRVLEMRKLLYEGRWNSPLFDTQRWTRDLEEAYEIAWARWERGQGGDIYL